MSEISLTASMRSNLLSLQQISKLQDSTQLRLSTGLKVNSAIDNPSSYYTASSLTNRAEDLSALLDSMGQSVQTIKAATEGIEKAEDLLSQMKAIAEQVNTGVYLPEKSYFEKLVGANGAVVSTAEELRAAIDSGKEEICVYGKIDLGDISTTGGISLQENQKLVGVNYYGNFGTEGEEFSSISATSAVADRNLIDITKSDCLVSDLNLSYENNAESGSSYAINAQGNNVLATLKNLKIQAAFSDINKGGLDHRAAITSYQGAQINIEGNINLQTSGYRGYGIYTQNKAITNISETAFVNIQTFGYKGFSIYTNGAECNILSNARINILTEGSQGYGLAIKLANCNIAENSTVNIVTHNAESIMADISSTLNLAGNLNIECLSATGIDTMSSEIKININSCAQLYINSANSIFNITTLNTLDIAQGAKITIEKNGQAKWYEVKENYHADTSTAAININASNIETTLNVAETNSWKTAGDIIAKEQQKQKQEKVAQAEKEAEEQANREVYQKQYNNALLQYDSLIKDSSYKGVNLLQADDLKVIFNENRSATLDVTGVDLSSDKIGLLSADWLTAEDVQKTLDQITNAKNTLRSAATKLGNYYSIITERETFTDNLINVLEEGADKLTLADMNEESANMLSLQTRQQLAINSLSLASQASQAVLRLF